LSFSVHVLSIMDEQVAVLTEFICQISSARDVHRDEEVCQDDGYHSSSI